MTAKMLSILRAKIIHCDGRTFTAYMTPQEQAYTAQVLVGKSTEKNDPREATCWYYFTLKPGQTLDKVFGKKA